MADDQHDRRPEFFERLAQSAPDAPPPESVTNTLRRSVEEVMTIQDITYGNGRSPLRVRGRLNISAEQAFKQIRPPFESVGYTPLLRHEDGMDVVRALPTVFESATKRVHWVAIALLGGDGVERVLRWRSRGAFRAIPRRPRLPTEWVGQRAGAC
jgi:hypothetical protein